MSTISFANPVMLPCFVDDTQVEDVLADGYIAGVRSYDGFRNKIEITPIRHDAGFIGALPGAVVGQSYAIGESHLMRLVCEANQRVSDGAVEVVRS